MSSVGDESSFHQEGALILMSGGQDSTTSLAWALKNFSEVSAICFFYNQKHSGEIEIAEKICNRFNIPIKIQDISFLKDLVISNLFKGRGNVNEGHELNSQVPAGFVPYRNLIFLTLAAAWAGTLKVRHLVTGVCETDYSGYADCRDVFIKSVQSTLNLATDFSDLNIIIHTPLMWLSKSETFRLAEDLGCLDIVLKETMTCYNGDETMNSYGKGCGRCPSCILRKKGYEEYRSKRSHS